MLFVNEGFYATSVISTENFKTNNRFRSKRAQNFHTVSLLAISPMQSLINCKNYCTYIIQREGSTTRQLILPSWSEINSEQPTSLRKETYGRLFLFYTCVNRACATRTPHAFKLVTNQCSWLASLKVLLKS